MNYASRLDNFCNNTILFSLLLYNSFNKGHTKFCYKNLFICAITSAFSLIILSVAAPFFTFTSPIQITNTSSKVFKFCILQQFYIFMCFALLFIFFTKNTSNILLTDGWFYSINWIIRWQYFADFS